MDAYTSRALGTSAWPRRLVLGATLLLLCLANLTNRTPLAHASGIPPIQATPWTITPGMQVSVQISEPVTEPLHFQLYASLQLVGNNQCPGGQAIPGLGILTIAPPDEGTTATGTWPAQLGPGGWWLCAIATDTASVFSVSQRSLTVVSSLDATPAPTATETLLPTATTIAANARTVLAIPGTQHDDGLPLAPIIIVGLLLLAIAILLAYALRRLRA